MANLSGPNVANTVELAVLLLSSQRVVFKAAPEAPLYELSRDVTSIPQKNLSIIFERVEDVQTTDTDGNGSKKQLRRHIFYLAHPAGAGFQAETCLLHDVCVAGGNARKHRTALDKALTTEARVRGRVERSEDCSRQTIV